MLKSVVGEIMMLFVEKSCNDALLSYLSWWLRCLEGEVGWTDCSKRCNGSFLAWIWIRCLA